MDKASAGQEQGVETAEAQHEESVADGLEQHADQHEGEPAHVQLPSVDGEALGASVETGAHGDSETATPGNAVEVINPKVSAARTKMYSKREKRRTVEQAARIKSRMGGKAWTADDLAKILKTSGAQGVIVQLNTHQSAEGVAVLKAANQWVPLLAALPKGLLGAHTKKALTQMLSDGIFDVADATLLFEIRFNHKLLDISSGANSAKDWSMDILQVMWRQLDALPAADVTLNTAITTFRAIAGDGAFGPSWEDPANVNTVDMGQDTADYENLEGTVRHEIGHGVHAQIAAQVNPWLQHDMQFWFTDDWDAWIKELGGYPKDYTDASGAKVPVDAAMKTRLMTMVESFTGNGGWDPAKATPDTGEDADGLAAWAAMPGPVKNACTQSKSNWFSNYANFQSVNGKRFFVNHYYHRPFTIGPKAMQAIAATNDTYTAMSEKEFFANCYAEYFRDPSGVKNHNNWGGNLSGSVKAFFKEVVVQRHPYDKFRKNQRQNKPKTT